MRRNIELIRALMLKLESLDVPSNAMMVINIDDFVFDNYKYDEIGHHLEMLVDAGFLVVDKEGFTLGGQLLFRRISYEGHEFLSSVRDDEIWQKTKKMVKQGGVETLKAVWEIAKSVGKTELKKRLGLDLPV